MTQGIPVGLIFPDDEERHVVFAKVSEAFELVARYDSRSFSRFRRDVASVLVVRTSGALAEWESAGRFVRLQLAYVKAPGTSPLEIASSLVHEGADACLHRLGIEYAEVQRARVEGVCFRSRLAFLREVPGAEQLIANVERQLMRDPGYWSDTAFKERQVAYLRELGFPGWSIRLLTLIRGPEPSNNRLQRPGRSRCSPPAAEPDR